MPTIKETEEVLDAIARNPSNPKAIAAQNKLGLNEKHIMAWQKARNEPDNQLTPQIKNSIMDKISSNLPVSQEGGGALDVTDRIKIKNLINERPDLQEKYLQSKGYETKRDPNDQSKVVVKKPGDIQFGAIDPEGFDRWDFLDIIEDVAGAVVGAATTGAKALGLVGAPATAGGSLAAASALGAASEAGLETGRQGLGMALGLREEFDPSLITQRTLIGAAFPGVSKIAGKVFKGASKEVAKRVPKFKPNAEQIKNAAKELNIKTTPGMLMDSAFVQKLENQLSQESGMLGGMGLRSAIKKNIAASRKAASDIVGDASGRTAFETGDLGKKQIIEAIEKRLEPAERIYNAAEKIFSDVKYKPNTKSVTDGIEAFAEPFKFNDKAIGGLKDFYEKMLNAKNLTDIKHLRTQVSNAASVAARAGDNESARAFSGFSKALTQVRSDTLKELIESNRPIAEVAGMGKEAIEKADEIYSSVARQVEETLANRGQSIKGGVKSFSKKQLDKIKEVDAVNKILTVSDPKKIDAVRKAYPEAFETLRAGKIEEILQRSLKKGEISPASVVKSIKKMPPETAALLLGEDALNKKKALEIVIDSIPENINPSGTSFSLILDRLFNGVQQIKSLGKTSLLSGAKYGAVLSRELDKALANELTPGLIRATSRQGLRSSMPLPDSTERAANPILPLSGGI